MNQNKTHIRQPFPSAAAVEHIKALIAAFLNAATTREQEAEIYSFFHAHVPGTLDPSLERYRGMFAWYGNLEAPAPAANPATRSRSFMRWMAGIAAGVAVLLTAGISTLILSGAGDTDEPNPRELHRGIVTAPVGRTGLQDTTHSTSGDSLILLSPSESSPRK